MPCPQCSTEDLSNHHPDCVYHDDNFRTGEQQMIEGLTARVKELHAALDGLLNDKKTTYAVRAQRARAVLDNGSRNRP